MTVRLGNNHFNINIGWLQAWTIIASVCTIVWGGRAYYDNSEAEKKETNVRLGRIEKRLDSKNSTDSIQSINIGQLFQLRKDDSLSCCSIPNRQSLVAKPSGSGMKWYTERKVNGHILLTEVKQD